MGLSSFEDQCASNLVVAANLIDLNQALSHLMNNSAEDFTVMIA